MFFSFSFFLNYFCVLLCFEFGQKRYSSNGYLFKHVISPSGRPIKQFNRPSTYPRRQVYLIITLFNLYYLYYSTIMGYGVLLMQWIKCRKQKLLTIYFRKLLGNIEALLTKEKEEPSTARTIQEDSLVNDAKLLEQIQV